MCKCFGWWIRRLFQFPSNGKAYPKPNSINSTGGDNLFQFPSNGKAYPKDRDRRWQAILATLLGFNSLQTGKPIQRKATAKADRIVEDACFNSLQTGKPIQSLQGRINIHENEVSIPFKRESLSKGNMWSTIKPTRVLTGFNSLQTGKPIQSIAALLLGVAFCIGFNSLQTGKPIQSEKGDENNA